MSDHLSDLEKALGVVPEVPKLKGWDIIAAEHIDPLEGAYPAFIVGEDGESPINENDYDESKDTEWLVDFSGEGCPFGLTIYHVWAETKEAALVKAKWKLGQTGAVEFNSAFSNISGNIDFYPKFLTLDHIKEA